MNTATTPVPASNGVIEALVLQGDLSGMTPQQKVSYYNQFCQSLGLNPLTQPFRILRLQGKEKLYATKDCTDQLRKRDGISVVESSNELVEGIYVVTVKVKNGEGKTDMDIGAVNIAGLKGDDLANAYMKAITKAKRRATLSICGLAIMDESEIETVDATIVEMPAKRTLTDKAFGEALKRIEAGELSLIHKLRQECSLTNYQIETLVSLEDRNTVSHERESK